MEEFKPAERISALTRILVDNPYKLFPLGDFTEKFAVAKSTLSEDIATIRSVFRKMKLGRIETVTGAAGGIKYLPVLGPEEEGLILNQITHKLNDANRILPGGFLYMSDIIFSSEMAWQIGKIFASRFIDMEPDYIITMETKGIPIAMMTARAFNIPLVAIRRNSRVTEGSVMSINYLSGSSRKIQTMFLSRRALPEGVKVIIIDDFMKAGGTVRGMLDLVNEFRVEVKGIGVLVETAQPENKLIENYLSLLSLEEIDPEEGKVRVIPNT